MKVADILRIKGSAVKTVRPDETALGLSHQLCSQRIGAMIVSDDAGLSTASFPSVILPMAWWHMEASCQRLLCARPSQETDCRFGALWAGEASP